MANASELLAEGRPYCYYIAMHQDAMAQGGYVPSLIFKDAPGYYPMAGRGTSAAPWVWGSTYAEALEVCESYNFNRLGLTDDKVQAIVMSSMVASTRNNGY